MYLDSGSNGEMPDVKVFLDTNSHESAEKTEFRVKTTAYAANYYESHLQFMKEPTLENLRLVDKALDRILPSNIDVAEAESLVQQLPPLLDVGSGFESVLYSCKLVIKFQLKKPEGRWLNSVDITEKAAASFRDISLRLLEEKSAIFNDELVYVVEAWTDLVKLGRLEDQHMYPLIASALQWILEANHNGSKRRFVALIAAVFSRLSANMREQLIHDILSSWLRKSNVSTSTTIAELVLSLVAVAGSIPESIWENTIAIKSRQSIEDKAQIYYSKATAVSSIISRRFIDFVWPSNKNSSRRAAFQSMLAECARLLHSPQWPSAELFITVFLSSLFRLMNSVRNPRYAGFLFDCLQILYGSLTELKKDTHIPSDQLPQIVSAVVASCDNDDQANFLASRQCTLRDQPFYDYYAAMGRRKIGLRSRIVETTKDQWLAYLSQHPISQYSDKITVALCDLASREDLKDQTQIEIFHLMEKVIVAQPELFRIEWLDRLSYASPAICESLIPLISANYQATQNILLLQRASERFLAPGASQFKRRMMALLSSVLQPLADGSDDVQLDGDAEQLLILGWRVFLIASTDSDSAVRSVSDTAARDLFRRQSGSAVATYIMHAQAGRDGLIVQRGLKAFLAKSSSMGGGEDERQIRSLVKKLLESQHLDLATTFIKVNGGFTPMSQISSLFDLVLNGTDAEQSKALFILERALSARPRLILAPSLGNQIFDTLLTRLKTATHAQIERMGSILGQLVDLGNLSTRHHRSLILSKIASATLQVARNSVPAVARIPEDSDNATTRSKELVIFEQSVIIGGCIRYWEKDVEILRKVCHELIEWFVDIKYAPAKAILIRIIFGIASECEPLFNDERVDALFSSFKNGTKELDLFTRLLLKYMWSTSDKSSVNAAVSARESLSKDEDSGTALLSPNNTLQKHLSRLLYLAREEEGHSAVRVIGKAVQDNWLVADECFPVITCLCFSVHSGIAQTALRSFITLCERWPRNIGPKFVEGLKLINGNGVDSRQVASPFRPLSIMWKVLKDNLKQHNMKPMIAKLAQLFDHTVAFTELEILVNGLMQVDMDIRDAKTLAEEIEAVVNRFDPSRHQREEVAKIIISYLFSKWLRRRYGIREQHRASYSCEPDADLEPLNSSGVWRRLNYESVEPRDVLESLWRLPDIYGSVRMETIIYGDREKREIDFDGFETGTKRFKSDGSTSDGMSVLQTVDATSMNRA